MPGNNSVGQISLDLGLNSSKFNKQVKSLESSTKKTFTGLTSFLSNFLANMASNLLNKLLAGIGNFVKSAIDLASNLEEVENVVDTVFTNMQAQVDAFAASAMESFGLSEFVAKKYMGQLGSMAKSFGYSEEEAYNLARSITQLTADVASFYNLSTDEAFTKMKAIFTGETESLKELGVVMTQSALDSFAMAQGFSKSTSEMSESEKVALRYKFVMNQLQLAQGDFAKTSNGWANQVRVLSLRWDEFKSVLGEGFIAVLTPLVQMLNTLLSKMQQVAEGFVTMIKRMMGVSEEAATSTGSLSTSTGDAASSSEILAENTEKTAEAAENAKKSLMGFDEINKLAEPTSTASNNEKGDLGSFDWAESETKTWVSTLASSTMDALDKLKKDFKKWLKGLPKLNFDLDTKKVKENLQKGLENIWEGLKDFATFIVSISIKISNDLQLDRLIENLSTLWEKATKLASTIVQTVTPAFENFYDKGISPVVSWIGDKLNEAIIIVSEEFDEWADWFNEMSPKIEAFGGMLGEVALGFWSLLEPLADAAWTLAMTTFQTLSDVLRDFFTFILDNQAAVKVALYAVGGAWAAWQVSTIVAAIGTFLVNAPSLVAALASIKAATIGVVAAKVADRAETLAIIALYAKDAVVSLATMIATKAKELAAWIASTAAKAAEVATLVAVKVAQIAYTAATTAATAATWLFNAALAVLTAPITLIIAAIAAVIAIVVALIKHWDDVKAFAVSAVEKLKEVWGSVSAWFKANVTDPITNLFKGAINGIISAVNWLIRLLNNIQVKLPDWGILGEAAGKTFGFNLKEIPMLAEGGFVRANQPTLAVIGDNKREGEIVAPESKIAEAVAKGISQAMSFMGQTESVGGSQPIEIVVQIGEETIIHRVIEGINRENRRAGRLLITV